MYRFSSTSSPHCPPQAGTLNRAFGRSYGEKRVAGIEPACLAWEASALPLSYTRLENSPDVIPGIKSNRGDDELQELFSRFGETLLSGGAIGVEG